MDRYGGEDMERWEGVGEKGEKKTRSGEDTRRSELDVNIFSTRLNAQQSQSRMPSSTSRTMTR